MDIRCVLKDDILSQKSTTRFRTNNDCTDIVVAICVISDVKEREW